MFSDVRPKHGLPMFAGLSTVMPWVMRSSGDDSDAWWVMTPCDDLWLGHELSWWRPPPAHDASGGPGPANNPGLSLVTISLGGLWLVDSQCQGPASDKPTHSPSYLHHPPPSRTDFTKQRLHYESFGLWLYLFAKTKHRNKTQMLLLFSLLFHITIFHNACCFWDDL